MATNLLKFEDVANDFWYDPDRGFVFHKIGPRKDLRATFMGSDRYRRVRTLDNRTILEHRVAWVLYHKKPLIPPQRVRFRNGDRSDLRIINLYRTPEE